MIGAPFFTSVLFQSLGRGMDLVCGRFIKVRKSLADEYRVILREEGLYLRWLKLQSNLTLVRPSPRESSGDMPGLACRCRTCKSGCVRH